MTLLELFKNNDAETIAKTIVEHHYAGIPGDFILMFDFQGWDDCDCPDNCEYLEKDWSYEDSWMNGMCDLNEGEKCPYHVDRKEVLKRSLIEWLNEEIKE